MAAKSRKGGIEDQFLDFSSTWDAPFEAAKSREITSKEFLKKLDPEKVYKNCPHKVQPIKCPCGKQLQGAYCTLCCTMFCGIQCLPKDLEDELSGECWTQMDHSRLDCNIRNVSTPADPQSASNAENNLKSIPLSNKDLSTKYTANRGDNELPNDKGSLGESTRATCDSGRSTGNINKMLSAGRGKQIRKRMEPPSFLQAQRFSRTEKLCNNTSDSGLPKANGLPQNLQVTTEATCEQSEQNICVNSSDTSSESSSSTDHNKMLASIIGKFSNSTSKSKVEVPLKSEQRHSATASLNSFEEIFGKFEKQTLVEETNETFIITHFYSFNKIHVIKCSVSKQELEDLMDDINDFCLDEPCLDTCPTIGKLVCAPYANWNKMETMQRAIVVQVYNNYSVSVYFIDFGETLTIPLQKLKNFHSNFLRKPLLGYKVKVRGVPDDPDFVLRKDFEEKIHAPFNHQKITMTKLQYSTENVYEADISCGSTSLAKNILDLQKWDWEKLYEAGLTDDTSIISDSHWNTVRNCKLNADPLEKQIELLQMPVRMELSQLYLSDYMLSFKNIQIPRIERERRIMEDEIRRYTNQVKATQFYPKLLEVFLFKPTTTDEWTRAQRIDMHSVYCLDTGVIYSIENDEHKFRPICPEFLKLPSFAIQCVFSDFQRDSKLQEAIEQNFKPGEYYDVEIVEFDPANNNYKIRCKSDAFLQLL